PLPALRDRPADAAAPAVACPAARPVMIIMLPTPPTLFHPSAVLSRDPRRSPAPATKSSEIAPRQRRDQPVEWPQPATIVPTLPFNLPTASSYCLNGYPQRQKPPYGPPTTPPSAPSQTRSFNRACAPVTGAQTLIRLRSRNHP